VTERGRPIAKLTPAGSSATLPQHLAEMENQGLIKIGTAKLPKDFWTLPRPNDSKGLVLKSLLQEREKGRSLLDSSVIVSCLSMIQMYACLHSYVCVISGNGADDPHGRESELETQILPCR
jgi:hypothetical protein